MALHLSNGNPNRPQSCGSENSRWNEGQRMQGLKSHHLLSHLCAVKSFCAQPHPQQSPQDHNHCHDTCRAFRRFRRRLRRSPLVCSLRQCLQSPHALLAHQACRWRSNPRRIEVQHLAPRDHSRSSPPDQCQPCGGYARRSPTSVWCPHRHLQPLKPGL